MEAIHSQNQILWRGRFYIESTVQANKTHTKELDTINISFYVQH